MPEKSYILSRDEIETDITIDYAEKRAFIYSCYYPFVKKIRALAEKFPENAVIEKDNGIGIHAYVPISWIKITPQIKRVISDEAKQKAIENLKRYRESKELA